MKVKQTMDGITDETELFTTGEFRYHNGSYYIDYDESEATGYEGSHAQFKVDDDILSMTRTGANFTGLVFENGVRHYCHYGTEFGECMVGITTSVMKQNLSSDGGEINLKYSVDINSGLMTENEITIRVKM